MVRRTAHETRVGRLRVGWVECGPDRGTAEGSRPVVLVHGLGTSGAWWQPTVPALAGHRRTLLVDLPGFGSSRGQAFRLDTAADLLADWMAAIGLERADLVGHSLGGLVAADLAARRGELVDRLVLVDAAGLALHQRVSVHLRNVVHGGVRAPLRMYPVAVACVLRCGPLTIARAAHQVLASDLGERLGRIDAPTLVVWGSRDELLPVAFGQRLAERIPSARFVTIDGAGHSPMWERPGPFERALLDFLAEPVPERPGRARPVHSPVPAPAARTTATRAAVVPDTSATASTAGRLVSRYVAVGDWSLHVRVGRPDGPLNGPPIVFVHGFVISTRYHVPTMRRLARRHLVFGPDLPGFGWSSKPDEVLDVPGLGEAVVAAMDAAGIGHAVLVGNSLGSQIAAQVAADHPDRVLATVLTGPTFDPAEHSLAGQVGRLIADIPREHPSLLFEHLPDYVLAGIPRAIATLRHARRHRIETVLPLVRAPTTIVRGEHDSLVPRRWALEAAGLVPNGRALEVRGAGHAVTYGAPRAMTRIVEDVVSSLAATARPQADGVLPMRIVTATHRRRPDARPRRTRAGPPR